MPRAAGYIPQLCVHKRSGRAFVKLDGKQVYLGPAGEPGTQERYDEVVGAWLAGRRKAPGSSQSGGGPTIGEIVALKLKPLTGSNTDRQIRVVLEDLRRRVGEVPAVEFGSKRFARLLAAWSEAGLAHSTIVNRASITRRIFRWAVAEEMIPVTVYQTLKTVAIPRAGQPGGGRETDPVRPVPDQLVEATLKWMRNPLAAMVRLQRLTGMRPGEVCGMTWTEVDREGPIWMYRPRHHKNHWRGQGRAIAIGPKGQAVLAPYAARRTGPVFVGPRTGRPYTANLYAQMIRDYCLRHQLEPWSPNRLRHSLATEVRDRYTLAEAQSILGHTSPQMTARYAREAEERAAAELAERVMREIG